MPSRIQTLPFGHTSGGEVELALGKGALEHIRQVSSWPSGWCFWNVDEQVRQHGGEGVLGWKVQHWPDRFVTAVYHAVWRMPGTLELVDVTSKVASDAVEGTTFVADERHKVDLTRPQYIGNWYQALAELPEVDEFVAAEVDQLDYQRRSADELLRAGARWSPWTPWDIAVADPAVVDRIFAERRKRDERLMRAVEALDASSAPEAQK